MENFSWGATILFLGICAVIIFFVVLLKSKKQSISIVFKKQDDDHPLLFKGVMALATFLSFFLATYCQWGLAALTMLIIVEHEYGHIWGMRKKGIAVRGFFFVPFLGGVTLLKKEIERYPCRETEAFFSLTGPVWGLGLAVLFSFLYLLTGWDFLRVCAGLTAVINLLNLLPINPMDGGRVIKCALFGVSEKLGLGFLALNSLLAGGLSFYVCQILYHYLNVPLLFASLYTPADPGASLPATFCLFLLFMILFIIFSCNLVFIAACVGFFHEYRDRSRPLPKMTAKQISLALLNYCLTCGALILIVLSTDILKNLTALFAG